MRFPLAGVIAATLTLGLAACNAGSSIPGASGAAPAVIPAITPATTATPATSITPGASPSATASALASPSATQVATPSATPVATPSATPQVTPSPATTAAVSASPLLSSLNILANGNFEESSASATGSELVAVPGWTLSGGATLVKYGTPNFLPTSAGGANNFLAGGPNNAHSTATQTVSLAAAAAQIDTGDVLYNFSGRLGGFSTQSDGTTLTLTFLNAGGSAIGTTHIGPVTTADRVNNSTLLSRLTLGTVPAGTRSAVVLIDMTRFQGSYNDGYVDDVFLGLALTQT